MEAKAQIFLSYALEDKEKVEQLYQRLSAAGFKPWMDKIDILPGEQWEPALRKAIRSADFFLVCLSATSVKKRGWVQREMKQALDLWQEKLEDDIYLLPVRLEDCEVPESLRKFQWVDLFEKDGWTRLVQAIHEGMKRRGEAIKPVVQEPTSFEPYPAYEEPSPDTEMETPEESPERVQVSHGYALPRMSFKQKAELMNALLACPTMSNRSTRDTVVNNLPSEIEDNIQRSSTDRADVDHIVTTCLNYPDGMKKLIEIVRFYEGDSIPMQRVDELMSRAQVS